MLLNELQKQAEQSRQQTEQIRTAGRPESPADGPDSVTRRPAGRTGEVGVARAGAGSLKLHLVK
jgi:hypothetical protein